MMNYLWGTTPVSGVDGLPIAATFFGREKDLMDLPEEVRQALEERQDEIRTRADMQAVLRDLNMRK